MRRAKNRWIAFLASAAATSVVLSSAASAASGPHPCFNDQGAIPWYRSLPEAQAAARASGKLIFVESGRLECTQCRRLVAGIIAYEPVRSRMAAIAVGYADDCDDSNPTIQSLFEANLPNATMLPLVAFVTPDLQWITGWSGGKMVGPVLGELDTAEAWHRRLSPARVVAPPAPIPAVAARSVPSTPTPKSAPMGMSASEPRLAAPAQPLRVPAPAPAPAPLKSTPAASPAPTRDLARPIVASPPPPVPPPAPPTASLPASTPPVLSRFAASRPVARAETATPPALLPAPPAIPSLEPIKPPPARVATPIERARAAAAREAWGEVIRIADREIVDTDGPLAIEIEALFDRACAWTLRTMSEAEHAALERRSADARKTLERMRTELEGTGSPALVDADRGLRAMDALTAVEAGSPDGDEGVETIRRRAYAEFRGSRWAALFRSR